MNCFSMIKKFIGEKFLTPEPILPINRNFSGASELKPIGKVEVKVQSKKSGKKSDEDEDLFKEMEPNYVAARRIGATTLISTKKPTSSRFDMEAEGGHSWDVDDFNN